MRRQCYGNLSNGFSLLSSGSLVFFITLAVILIGYPLFPVLINSVAKAQNEKPPADVKSPLSGFFSNPAVITFHNTGPFPSPCTPYPSTINVTGQGFILKVTVRLFGINHTFPDDIEVLLVSPSGQKVTLMGDAGGSPDSVNVNITLDDGAVSSLPDSGGLVSGTFRPTYFGTGNSGFPAPAPAGPYSTTLSAFNGMNANGIWSLYVVDDTIGDIGSISGGWGLSITTFADPCVLSCTASATATGTVGAPISFAASANQTGCGGAPTYDWNFGDGTAHSSQQNSTHTYAAAGNYSWTLTTNLPGATPCVRTGSIAISPPEQYCLTTSVPTGGGSISGNPSGSCHNRGSSVTLTASADSGFTFNGWSIDGVSFSSNPVLITMNRSKNVAAHFVPQTTSLYGNIGIKDESRTWELNGPGIVSLNVFARPTGGGNLFIANMQGSRYSFSNLPQGTNYDLSVVLTYKDIVSEDNLIDPGPFQLFGCAGGSFNKTSRRSINNLSPQSTPQLDIKFPPPLVMVHGILSCYNKWYENGDATNHWDNYARASGFITFTPNYHFDNDYTFAQRASEVKAQIESNLNSMTANPDGNYPPWFYIAHSMGGLVGRTLTGGEHKESSLVRSLKKLYILGTPNNGTDKAFGSLTFLSERSIQSLFNSDRWYPTFGGKEVRAYAGDDGWDFDTTSDSVVPIESVFNIDQANCSFNGERWSCTKNRHVMTIQERYLARFSHGQLGSSESRQLFFAGSILPDICSLSGFICAPSSASAKIIPFEPNETQELPVTLQIVTSQFKTLTANETQILPFTVGPTDLLVVDAFVSEGSVTFSLIDPSGQVIDFDSLPPTAGQHNSDELGEIFALSNPAAGEWNFKAVAGTSGATFKANAAEKSPIAFDGFATQPTLIRGQTSHLQGQWSGQATGIGSPTVTAKVADEAGMVIGTITFFDDGMHVDGAAGDGVFGGDTPALSNIGRYTITLGAQGVFNGQPFVRWAEASVDVISSIHRFTGSFSDGVYDSDQDDIFDLLRETVVVHVSAAGTYIVSADLEDAQGYFIDHAVGNLEATAIRAYSVDLEFDMNGVFCGQFSGPFSIKNLTLSDASTQKVIDIWNGTVTTQAYNGALFGCAAGAPAPVINGVQPGSLFPGSSRQIIINGKSFANGAQVSFGPEVNVSSVNRVSSSTLLVQASVSAMATPGQRSVTVTNPDGRSATATGLFSVTNDQPPAVSFNNLADQQVVNGVITVSATATDDLGVQRVEFYVNGTLVSTDMTFPYQFVWDTSSLANGPYTLAAKVFDTANQVTTSQINAVASCISACSPSSLFFQSRGGAGGVNVSAPGLCNWSLVSNDSWIVLISEGDGSGNSIISFEARENFTSSARVGSLNIGGRTITVFQNGTSADSCQYTISPTFNSFSATGGGGIIEVATGGDCGWQASSNVNWITITSGVAGIGSGTVGFSVSPNPGPSGREGIISIAGRTFSVKQK